jgi:hypothetical protein
MRFEVGDETFEAGPGSAMYLPMGVPHAFRNMGMVPCRFVVVVSPAGLEGFFSEAALLAASEAGPEQFEALASTYGLQDASEWYEARRRRVSGDFAFEL